MRLRRFLPLFILCSICASSALGQTETATLSGIVTDPQGKPLSGVQVQITNQDTNVSVQRTTNDAGLYVAVGLKPGRYRVSVTNEGFRKVDLTDLVLNVQDVLSRNFQLQLGPVSTSITVVAEENKINTTDATVSTVVDRQFADNLPMNGRSFQTLIQLTPGVNVVPSNAADEGQFSVNGQRATSNYWMVDGVSANIGVNAGNFGGNGFGGTLGAFSAQGGTNSLVSVDAMQEFRIQTSTYAPEFGRTPGGQISIVTRSGTNQFQGSAFDYFRNDALDASDWFVNYNHLLKPKERQNDFGSTFSGPVVRDRTFFFFSYEGLRLRLPRVGQSTVPDLNARQTAIPALQPFLNAYPLPNGADNVATGAAQFNASYADSSVLDAYSLRLDHELSDRIAIFGRYNYSPSESVERGVAAAALSLNTLTSSRIATQTATLGATWALTPTIVNDLRFNQSRVNASSARSLDNFGGAVPLSSLPLPSPYTDQNAAFRLQVLGLIQGGLFSGENGGNLQRQINIVDGLSFTRGSHDFKLGVDFRQLSPRSAPLPYVQSALFRTVDAARMGTLLISSVSAQSAATLRFRNVGVYAQDTWRIVPRVTATYGLRWDLDVVPKSIHGPDIVAVTGYDLNDLSKLAIAPAGTAPFRTSYSNAAPRFGLAYQLREDPDRATVLRGGLGVFYDLLSSQVGASVVGINPPFGVSKTFVAGTFPLDATRSAAPAVPSAGALTQVYAFNPNLKSPYTLQWNIALEQALGRQQTVSVSYVGAAGRRLLQTSVFILPASNPNITVGTFLDNTASSNYNALQVQFQRRMSHGLQILGSYTWAHSLDNGSAASSALASNAGSPGSNATANRGPSDFDIRHTLSAGVTYDIPVPKLSAFTDAILQGWSIDSAILARSGAPVDVRDLSFFTFNAGIAADIRPDLVPGQPLYLYGSNCASVMQALGYLAPGQRCPGDKAFNPNAFQDPPIDPNTKKPLRQGNVPRNFLRGFGAFQWDLALHRQFAIRESVKLQFRGEVFNVLNHTNFGQPNGGFGRAGFGLASQTLAQYLNSGGTGGNLGAGAFSPLYQIGGPRSIQLGLKLFF